MVPTKTEVEVTYIAKYTYFVTDHFGNKNKKLKYLFNLK